MPCDDVFVVVAMHRPTSCCTCRSLTHVTTFGPFTFTPGAYQASGTTRMFGIVASHATESRRMSDDWMSSTGMACESVLCKGPNTERGPAPMEALMGATEAIGDGG
jgi:hypothetical protein